MQNLPPRNSFSPPGRPIGALSTPPNGVALVKPPAPYRDPAIILIDQLKEIYIDGELELLDTTQWYPRITRKDFTIGLNLMTNGIDDPNLVVGQVLVLPGAKGKAMIKPSIRLPNTTTRGGSGGGSNIQGPKTYTGGRFLFPVVGGNNYISQYFHYGHYAIDIAADYGATVRAAAGGIVTFAGWKSNGGGYQVWIAHGSGLYTTYNHMSAITVGRGQHVGRGQTVGRVGQSGNATGPHCHFEVWRGPIWDGGQRVNPLGYL